jgi:hypothetical protein
LGLNIGSVYWDNFTPALYEEAIRRYEGMVSHLGPLVIRTGQYTGRSANLRVNRKFGEGKLISLSSLRLEALKKPALRLPAGQACYQEQPPTNWCSELTTMYFRCLLIFCLLAGSLLLAQEKAAGGSRNEEATSSFRAVNASIDTILQEYEGKPNAAVALGGQSR